MTSAKQEKSGKISDLSHLVPVLELNRTGKTYGKHQVLQDISFRVNKGEIFGLLGPNGAGKSTLMKIITGLTKPDSGQISILGYDAIKERSEIKPLISFVPQINNLEKELTVSQALRIYGQIFGIKNIKTRLEEILDEFKLHDFKDKEIQHLSGGMSRRVLIARAILTKPKFLLLDEPTVGLDPDIRWDIWDIILNLAKSGTTIFLSTHYMDEAQKLCQRVALLRLGILVDVDTPDNIIKKVKITDGQTASLETAFIKLLGGCCA